MFHPCPLADEAVASARELFSVVAEDRTRVLELDSTSITALRLFELLPRSPIVTVGSAIRLLHASKPTASRAFELLSAAGVLEEITGKKRDRWFTYRRYLDVLRAGTDLRI